MGDALLKVYEKAYQMGGLVAQMRLAMLTKMPSTKAALAMDTQENLTKFEEALQKLAGEQQQGKYQFVRKSPY